MLPDDGAAIEMASLPRVEEEVAGVVVVSVSVVVRGVTVVSVTTVTTVVNELSKTDAKALAAASDAALAASDAAA